MPSLRLIALLLLACAAPACAEDFDKPLRVVKRDMGVLDSYSIVADKKVYDHKQLVCTYYKGWLIKELESPDLIGDDMIGVAPSSVEHPAVCEELMATGEWRADVGKFCGGLLGVKDNLLFLGEDDVQSSVDGFLVYRLTDGKELLRDASLYRTNMEIDHLPSGLLRLRYTRMLPEQDCSPTGLGNKCWAKIRELTGLPEASRDACEATREAYAAFFAKACEQSDTANCVQLYVEERKRLYDGPMSVAYPVETVFDAHPTPRAIGPISNCIPME